MVLRELASVPILLSLLFGQPSFRLPEAVEAEQEFHVIDANNDGVISPAEAEATTRYSLFPMVFDAVDRDGSGAIEYREWDHARAYLRSLDRGGR